MTTLSIDIETFSGTDIKGAGTYRYTEDPAFTILLLAYSIDGGPVEVLDLEIDEVPYWFIPALKDGSIEKHAYNAAFERRCLAVYLGIYLPPEQWHCTMIKSAMVGLPFGLDAVCKALKLDQGKIGEGKALIKYFCSPCKPTKANGGRTRNLPHHNAEKWMDFIEYNKRDVELERRIAEKISFYEVPDTERQLWALDQNMNDKGVKLDLHFINRAIELDTANLERLEQEARDITGIDNPNSGAQLVKWLIDERGEDGIEAIRAEPYSNGDTDRFSLAKNKVIALLHDVAPGCDVEKVLSIRQELNKTSNKKYYAMLDCVCADGRARGTIQYYGAGRTGRYSGRLFQPQNLTKTVLPNRKKAYDYYELDDKELQIARDLILAKDTDTIEMLFGNVSDTLSACIRTALVAEEGKRLLPVDLEQIEARVLAWLSGEQWKLDVFNSGGKIYMAAGAKMFKVPIETVRKGTKLYDKSKIGELALGYQGAVNALIAMGALEMGLTEPELEPLVYDWRNANKKIVQCWYDLNRLAVQCVSERIKVKYSHGITMHVEKNVLWITLPSGRKLAYLRPEIVPGKFGGDQVQYEGMHPKTKQWGKRQMYGGLIVENLCQAIARDVLADKMLKIDKTGYNLLLSVHDEVIPEEVENFGTVEELVSIMSAPIPWAKGLPLGADGFESKYYKK